MSRQIHVAITMLMVAGAASGIAVFVIQSLALVTASMSDEQRVRERFFGAGAEPVPINKGQEMRPRW